MIEERRAVERAVDLRRHEFAGGRACAHASLAVLECGRTPILASPDRSPVWPVGTVGSITHSDGFCLAAVSTQSDVSIGVDAEAVGRVTDEVAEVTMSSSERRWIAASAHPETMATVVFTTKEALYKAQHPVTGSWLDFVDVEVSQTPDADVLRIDLIEDVPEVRRLSWPVGSCWTVIEPSPGQRLVVAAVVVRTD